MERDAEQQGLPFIKRYAPLDGPSKYLVHKIAAGSVSSRLEPLLARTYYTPWEVCLHPIAPFFFQESTIHLGWGSFCSRPFVRRTEKNLQVLMALRLQRVWLRRKYLQLSRLRARARAAKNASLKMGIAQDLKHKCDALALRLARVP